MRQASCYRLLLGSVVVGGLLFGLAAAAPPNVSPEVMRAAALMLFAIVFWAMDTLPGHVTAFAFFLLAVIWGEPTDVVFSGFQSGALWLAFSGLVMGIAIQRTGLAARLARAVVDVFGHSYSGLVCGLVLVGIALMFVMPSATGRVLLLVPLAEALAERVGFERGSRGASGLTMAAASGTFMPAAAVLPANMPNVLLMGAAGTLHEIALQYGPYLALHLPVTGVLKALAVVFAVLVVFPAKTTGASQGEKRLPLSRDEWLLSVILVVTLGLWMSDIWHGIGPAWVGLSAAIFCLLPPVGLMPEDAFERVNFSFLIYLAGIIGLGSLVASSGLGDLLGELFLAVTAIESSNDAYNFAALVIAPMALGLFTTMPGVPAVLTPFATEVAEVVGWPVLTVLMTQVVGFSTVLLPYQAPPYVAAMERSGVSFGAVLRLFLVMAVVTLVVLTPLNFLWWQYLGYFSPAR